MLGKFAKKSPTKLAVFLLSVSVRSFPAKFLAKLPPVNPARLSVFFSATYQKPSISNEWKQCPVGYNYDRDVLVEKYVEQKMSKNW